MKIFLEQTWKKYGAILISALLASVLSFCQSIAHSTGVCPLPAGSPETSALLGALIKGAHSVSIFFKNNAIV